MSREIKSKTLHYRRASYVIGNGNLQQLLRAALAKQKTIDIRLEQLGNANDFRCINDHPTQYGMQFGNLLAFERGTNRLLLSTDTKVATLDVAQVAPPPIKGTPSEFLDAILYFGIQGNHVILLQSHALSSKHIETHINWLLDTAGLLQPLGRVELLDVPSADLTNALKSKSVKRVKFGAPFLDISVASGDQTPEQKREHLRLTPKGIGATVLKMLIGENAFSKLHLEKAMDGNLTVALEVSYDRTTSVGGQAALNAIARELRHVDEDDVAVVVPGLGTVKGKDMKLSDTRRITSYEGLLDQNEVFQSMHEWLRTLLEAGIVSGDDGATRP